MYFDLDLWPTDLKTIGTIYSSRTTYLPNLKLLGQSDLEFSVAQGNGDQHELWPTDLNIDSNHLLIMDYLPTKFEVYEARGCWVIVCKSYFGWLPTDRPTYRHVQSNMPLPSFKGGHNKLCFVFPKLECLRNTYVTCYDSKVSLPRKCDYQKLWQPNRHMGMLRPLGAGCMSMSTQQQFKIYNVYIQWWFVNPGSDSPEISLIRTKSARTDFLFWTDGRFSNPENSSIRKYRPGTNVSGLTNHHCICPDTI